MNKINYNSEKNYAIKSKFVQREVDACISDFAEYLFNDDSRGYASWDDWENLYVYVCPKCDEINSIKYNNRTKKYKCTFCGITFDEEPDTEPQEIFEFLIVSTYLGEKLKEKGQPVYDRGYYGYIWGRTCTGQAIASDHIISEICEEMEILEGQKFEWKVD